LPRAYWLLWSCLFTNRAGTFVMPFLTIYLVRRRGVDPVAAGVLLGSLGVGLAVSAVVGGRLADRYGRRSTMTLGLTASAAVVLLLAVAEPLWLVAVAIVLFGLVREVYRPGLNAMVVDVVLPQQRTRAFGLLHWAMNLGTSAALLGGGVLVRHGFTVVFVIDAATTLAAAALVWLLLPPDAGQGTAADGVSSGGPATPAVRPQAASRPPYTDRRFVRFCVLTFLGFVIYFQGFSTLPLAITDLGFSAAQFAVIAACNGVTITVLQPVAASLLGRLPVDPALAAGYLLVGVGFALTATAHTVPTLAGTVVLWSLGEIILASVGSAVPADLAPPDQRGRYLGWYVATLAVASAAAPVVGAAIYRQSPLLVWLGCGLLGASLATIQLTGPDAPRSVGAGNPD
jgi:MFS family permease